MVRWQCFCKPLPNKCYSLPWQERARSQAQLSPSQVPVLAERRQSSAGSFLRARSPDPAQLSSLRETGTQPNKPSDSSGLPQGGGSSYRLWPRQTAATIEVTQTGMRKGFTAASRPSPGQWMALVSALEPCRTQPPACLLAVPSPTSSPAGPRLGKLEGLREKAGICLLPHSPPEDHSTTNCWLSHLSNGASLTVGCLWRGPTEGLTNGWGGLVAW